GRRRNYDVNMGAAPAKIPQSGGIVSERMGSTMRLRGAYASPGEPHRKHDHDALSTRIPILRSLVVCPIQEGIQGGPFWYALRLPGAAAVHRAAAVHLDSRGTPLATENQAGTHVLAGVARTVGRVTPSEIVVPQHDGV